MIVMIYIKKAIDKNGRTKNCYVVTLRISKGNVDKRQRDVYPRPAILLVKVNMTFSASKQL